MLKTNPQYSRLQSSSVCCGQTPRYKYCTNSAWTYNIEDVLHITLILLSLILIIDFSWIQFFVYPNLFICIVATTVFVLNGLDDEKCGIHIIILIPFWILAVSFTFMLYVFCLFLFPFRVSSALNHDYGMEQFAFNHRYQAIILTYLFNTKRNDQELRISILATTYYLLSLYKNENEDKNDYKNLILIEYIANKNIDGITLEEISWSNIREMSSDKTSFHLIFAFCINIFVIIYRIYHTFLILYIWIYHDYVHPMNEPTYSIIMVLLILHTALKIIVLIRCCMEISICFVMFHILVPNQWIPVLNKNELKYNYEWIDVIQIVDEILNISIYQKKALEMREDISIDLINLILQYATYYLPIDGDIDAIHNILYRYLMIGTTDDHNRSQST